MTNTTLTKTRTRAQAHAGEYEVSKGTIAAISTVPALIGLWAAACFVSATITSGGLFELARNWFQAVTGM